MFRRRIRYNNKPIARIPSTYYSFGFTTGSHHCRHRGHGDVFSSRANLQLRLFAGSNSASFIFYELHLCVLWGEYAVAAYLGTLAIVHVIKFSGFVSHPTAFLILRRTLALRKLFVWAICSIARASSFVTWT